MIFKKIILNNFRPYYSDNKFQEIEFSSGEKNVTLIKAENGTGKTTLLEAFKWCFYGKKLNLKNPNIFVNEKAFSEISTNDTISVSVEIIFEENGGLYKLIRSVNRRKSLTNTEKEDTQSIILKDINNDESFKNNVAQDKINEFLPPELNFFFDGERLTQMETKKEKKNEIINVLGIKAFENAITDLRAVERKYEKKIAESNKANQLYDEFISDQRKINEELESQKVNLEKNKSNLKNINSAIENINTKLKQIILLIANKDEIGKELANAENEKKRIEKELYNNFSDYKKYLSKNSSMILGKKSIIKGFEILEKNRKEGKIPSNIKETLIDDLIKLGSCICGRSLGNNEIKALNSLRNEATDSELEAIFNTVYQTLKRNCNIKIEDLKKLLFEKKSQYLKSEKSYDQIRKKILDLSNSFKKEDEENIEKKDSLNSSKDDYLLNKGKTEQAIYNLNEEVIPKLNKKLRGIQNKIDNEQKKTKNLSLLKSKEMTKEILKAFETLYDLKLEHENKKLNIEIQKIYNNVTRKGYFIELTSNFELKVYKNKLSKDEVALSTGESKMVILCFIGALVDLARKLNKDNNQLDINGGIYPIVLDSPYGDLDVEHKREMTSAIQQLSDQIIIFASSSQWSNDVDNIMKDRVGNIYELINKNPKNSNEKHEYSLITKIS